MSAYIRLDGWAGRERIPCEVVGETPKRYRVRLLQSAMLPGRRCVESGAVVLVPRYAVVVEQPAAASAVAT